MQITLSGAPQDSEEDVDRGKYIFFKITFPIGKIDDHCVAHIGLTHEDISTNYTAEFPCKIRKRML